MDVARSPRVSVLMPVYYAEKYLRPAIDSVLNQTFRDFELLVLNDGSRDRSMDIVAEYRDPRIRAIHNEVNKGLIETLNGGIAAARGVYIARQDADDIALEERFEKQARALDADPETALVGSWLTLIDQDDAVVGSWQYPTEPEAVAWALLFNSATGHSSVMYRTEAVRALGGYSRAYVHAEDYDLWSRMSERWRLRNLPEVLELYRVHAGAVSSTSRGKQEENRARISRRNMERLLERDLEEDVLQSIAGVDDDTPQSVVRAVEALRLLHLKFLAKHALKGRARRGIEDDLLERIGSRLSRLSGAAKARAIWRLRRSLPARFFLSGRCAALFLGASLKRSLKGLFGRKEERTEVKAREKVGAPS